MGALLVYVYVYVYGVVWVLYVSGCRNGVGVYLWLGCVGGVVFCGGVGVGVWVV